MILKDHDYCVVPEANKSDEIVEKADTTSIERSQSMDHDYCSPTTQVSVFMLYL